MVSTPPTSRTTTRFSSLPTPRIADCGWLMMIGAAKSEPETPWLEMVKVPPAPLSVPVVVTPSPQTIVAV